MANQSIFCLLTSKQKDMFVFSDTHLLINEITKIIIEMTNVTGEIIKKLF